MLRNGNIKSAMALSAAQGIEVRPFPHDGEHGAETLPSSLLWMLRCSQKPSESNAH